VKGTWAVLLFAMTWPMFATFMYFVALASPSDHASGPNPWLQAFYSGSKVLQFSLPVLWIGFCRWHGQRMPPITLNLRGLGLGLGFGLAVGATMLALYFGWLRGSSMLARTAVELQAKVKDFGLASPTGFILLATFYSVIHSLLEEYYWRWFVFGELRRLIAPSPAIVISGLAFMAHHTVVLWVYFPSDFFTAVVPFSLGVAIGGMVWAWLYQRTESIVAPWLSHLMIDTAIMIVGYDLLYLR
jgi:CAAX protease family protein